MQAQMIDYPTTGAATNLTCVMPFASAFAIALSNGMPAAADVNFTCKNSTGTTLFSASNGVVTGPAGVIAVVTVCYFIYLFPLVSR